LDEQDRIARVYSSYGEDARKRESWSAHNDGNRAMREEVLRLLLELVPQVRRGEGVLLDGGCGTGWWMARLAAAGVAPERLLGVELLAERVLAARKRVPGARVIEGDLRSLPVADGSCSLVLLCTVLSAMGSRDDVRIALGEARRVLGRGGTIVIWEPRIVTPNRHTRLIRRAELRRALGRDLTVRSVTLAPPLARRVGRAYRVLARMPPLRTHRLVLAQL
jgi:SAM-dependent methyltransferase